MMRKGTAEFELFPRNHDPGGKITHRLPPGIMGNAEFTGDRQQYRHLLRRWIGPSEQPYALWIGLNPSTATAKLNDPTITREWGFTFREGLSSYVKCNVMDYRATDPGDVLAAWRAGVSVRSDINLSAIREQAANAALIVACWGAIHPKLRGAADDVRRVLFDDRRKVMCLGLTKGGHPKHPLYLAADTPFRGFV